MKRLGAWLALCALGGCIPPGRPPEARQAAVDPVASPPEEVTDAPRIDAEFETLYDEQPVWEMRPVTANAALARGGTYIVQPGDTLRAIGERTGAGSEAIARLNGLEAPYVIRPGQSLAIPTGRFHKVGAGETGIAIAQAYGVRWADIIAANALSEPYVLRVGQRLLLPEGATSADLPPATIEQRAAAFTLDIDSIVTGGEPATDSAMAVAEPVTRPVRPLAPGVAVAEPKSFTGGFVWPATGRVAQRFGPAGEGAINQGLELSVAQSADVRASGEGVVAFVGDKVANYGGLILIRHGDGWITAYGRVASASVTRGQKVARGQIIGRAGSGATPLLFFQMRKNRVPVDPLKQLPPR